MMVPALVPEEAARMIRQETPTAPRQTLTWGESLAGSHVAPKSPGLPNCKRKGSKKARFTGQGFRDTRSCSSPFPWNHPSCPVQCMNAHTWMEMGNKNNMAVNGFGGGECLLQSQGTTPCPHSGQGTRCHNRTVCPKR